MQTLNNAFPIFSPIYRSTSEILDCKLDRSKNQSFPVQLRMLTALRFFPSQLVVRELAAVCNDIKRNLGDDAEELLV